MNYLYIRKSVRAAALYDWAEFIIAEHNLQSYGLRFVYIFFYWSYSASKLSLKCLRRLEGLVGRFIRFRCPLIVTLGKVTVGLCRRKGASSSIVLRLLKVTSIARELNILIDSQWRGISFLKFLRLFCACRGSIVPLSPHEILKH